MNRKKLIVTGSNHMDPSWRRAFIEHFDQPDGVVRPYADIEQEELSSYIDFAERYGMKFGVEQTISLRTYLERNPDMKERIATLLSDGRMEMMGGGECVIDVNLVSGESLIRNHYYSIRYLEHEFGVRPLDGCLADVFGVSAQIPQIFRGFGFLAAQNIARVRDNRPPFWRGLDGSLLFAGDPGSRLGIPTDCIADFGKYRPCPACRGEGCDVCGGSGFDLSYNFMFDEDDTRETGNTSVEKFLSKHEDAETLLLTYFSEEAVHPRNYMDYLKSVAEKHGREIEFLSYHEIMEMGSTGEKCRRLKAGGPFAEGEIDAPAEYNPMACGCYTSRVELKKQNRELEALLMGSEAICALCLPRDRYPAKMLELLWRKLELVQFHDCITGTHTDTSYDELIRVCREVRYGAMRIRDEALRALAADVSFDPALGEPFLLFNPSAAPLSRVPLKALLSDTKLENVEIFDASGKKLRVTGTRLTKGLEYSSLEVEFLGDLPAVGYSVFYAKEAAPKELPAPFVPDIKNEYYRITDTAIFASDGSPVVLGSPGALRLSSDHGHAWGRTSPEDEVMILEPKTAKAEKGDGYSKLIFTGSFRDKDLTVHRLEWTTTVTLYDGNPVIFFENELDWEGHDRRISLNFPLAGRIDEQGYYGVPFGYIRRGDVTELKSDTELGEFDEWPATGWFAGYDEAKDRSTIVYTGGLCGTRLFEDQLQLSILRAPGNIFYCVDNYGVREPGRHRTAYALEVVKGRPDDADPTLFASQFDQVRAYCARVPADASGKLPVRGRLLDVELDGAVISALKLDDAGDLVLRAYDPYGKGSAIVCDRGFSETDFLEKEEKPVAGDRLDIPAFGIRTVKIKK